MNLNLFTHFAGAALKALFLKEPKATPQEKLARDLTRQYMYAAATDETWSTMRWRDIRILKSPTDLWMYTEIIQNLKPKVILETGTYEGGSAVFLSDMLALFGIPGQMISVDIAPRSTPAYPRVTYLKGGSTDKAIMEQVKPLLREGPRIVILDSDHHYKHVLDELNRYSEYLREGDFLIVEDTACDYADGGPAKAVEDFLAGNARFAVQRQFQRLGLSFNLGGYLKCIASPK